MSIQHLTKKEIAEMSNLGLLKELIHVRLNGEVEEDGLHYENIYEEVLQRMEQKK